MVIPVVILAGGLGTRLREETDVRPKPMVDIGGQPILWHIMKIYANYGFKEFVICLGYKGDVIKEYFLDYRLKSRSLTIDLKTGGIDCHGDDIQDDWRVHLLDTGAETLTGGRVARAAKYIGKRPFMLTYGDGVSNININKLLEFHQQHGKIATLSAVRPPARFGGLTVDGPLISSFEEKPQIGEGWINGGFMVVQPEIVDYIEGDNTVLEKEPLEQLSAKGELTAYLHNDYWQCMDTIRDLNSLRGLWNDNAAPWKLW